MLLCIVFPCNSLLRIIHSYMSKHRYQCHARVYSTRLCLLQPKTVNSKHDRPAKYSYPFKKTKDLQAQVCPICEVSNYGTDLMQRRTRTRVLGYHSPSARTRSSLSFNGLELELERKLK